MKREKKHEDSVHEHAPGWNETLASESEAHVKVCLGRNTRFNEARVDWSFLQADSHDGKPDPAKTIEYLKKRDADDESATTNKSSS